MGYTFMGADLPAIGLGTDAKPSESCAGAKEDFAGEMATTSNDVVVDLGVKASRAPRLAA
jgi:hypothetical protein